MQCFQPLGGVRFGFVTLPPDSEAQPGEIDFEATLAELEQKLPGLASHMEPVNSGMHSTATVDYVLVGAHHEGTRS